MGKGKWMKKKSIIAGLFLTLITTASLAAAPVWASQEGGCDVEQVSICMPDVTVYYRSGAPEESYEAYLDGEQLEYQSTQQFKETGEGVDYYLMLDVSASISDEKFGNIKNGIIQFLSSKGEKDKCILVTFGNESKVVLNGEETIEDATAVVQALTNDDMETVLFQSIVQTAGMIEKAAQTEEKRRVIITVTDGEDCVTGQATAAEAQDTLKEKSIPLYALAVDVGKEEYINSFGEFARNTGGTLSIYSQGESADVFGQIRDTIVNSYVASFTNANNVASNKREDFTVKFLGQQATATREVIPTRWTPDTKAPKIKAVKKQKENGLRIKFSEPVTGADVPGNYKVEKGEELRPVVTASYSEKDGYFAVLTFDKTLYKGDYTISFSNITDQSMEKNSLEKQIEISLDGEEEKDDTTFLEKWWWAILAALLAVLAAAVAVVCVVYKRIKKNKGVIYVDGKATLASNIDVKQHVATNTLPQKDIQLIISDRVNGNCKMDVKIDGSIMAGRSDECDVYFDDVKMSRQHFALETDGQDVYLTDLESRNGTFINGVRVNQRRKLQNNDEITAGNVNMKILL